MVLWAMNEGGGPVSAVGHYLSGGTIPLLAFGAAVVMLFTLRPARLEAQEG